MQSKIIFSINFAVTKLILRNIYSYIQSNLQFGIILWGNSTFINKIFKVQKRIVRTICKAHPTAPCRPLFKEIKILTIYDLYILECCLFAHSNYDLLNTNRTYHEHNTRHKNNLKLTATTLSVIMKGPHNSLIKIYNKLPDALKILPKNKFKKNLLQLLVQRNFYNMSEYFQNDFTSINDF